jgi:hypothetical protein
MLRMISRKIPWLIAFEVLMASREHWGSLDPRDRRLAAELLKKSKGDPRRLTPQDRAEVRRLARNLHLGRFARSVAPIAWRGRRRKL